jgi:hypothetical protein
MVAFFSNEVNYTKGDTMLTKLLTDGLTPALASVLHIAAIHRRRVREGRTSAIDRTALIEHLGRLQRLWPPHSPRRHELTPSIQTVIHWVEEYVARGDYADDLDAILHDAFLMPAFPDDVIVLAGWVREVNAADGYLVIRIGDRDIHLSLDDASTYLPWWLLAEDVIFGLGLSQQDAELMVNGDEVPLRQWKYFRYDQEQLLDDNAFLAEDLSSEA